MLNLDQDQFITQYVTTFLATWAANGFSAHAPIEQLAKPPTDAAIHLARVAWCDLLAYGITPSQAEFGQTSLRTRLLNRIDQEQK